jgi:hypothetical protein
MKKIAFILSLLVFSGGFTPAQAALTKCKDGTYSSSTGRGTCSSHGGVASKYDKVNKEIKAKLLKDHGIVITDKKNSDPIQFEAVRLNLIKQQNLAKAAVKAQAQAKIDDAKKLEARLNPNNSRQYVMPYSSFTICEEYGGQYRSVNGCVGFLVCEQQLVNSGYTTLIGSNSLSSLEQWLRMGQLVQTPDNPSCASIKGSPIEPKGR